jgi:hypothetical protein
MKKLLLAIAIIVLASASALAQRPKLYPSPSPVITETPPPELTEAQQKRIAEAVTQSERVAVEAKAAQQRVESLQSDAVPFSAKLQATLEYLEVKARVETAQAKTTAQVYFVMAQLRVSPDEYELRPGTQGGFILARKAKSSIGQ